MRRKKINEEIKMLEENKKQNVEAAVMQLVVDSYMHGDQTCQLTGGKSLGVSIMKGSCDNVLLFIDDTHKVTIEVEKGISRITVMKTHDEKDIPYIVPFAKSLGLSEGVCLQKFLTANY
ncbi:MAG: hypothetical protein FWF42_03745 [Streptococcaceae bacterium]|nr:hypothetical protein [Streptococcaceae bacterium]MCL2681714.1 hypothetical protein [Streptococcaceae bacterium]MCL2858785.1 hypothetical protein [Streptococcaceae bacterium]